MKIFFIFPDGNDYDGPSFEIDMDFIPRVGEEIALWNIKAKDFGLLTDFICYIEKDYQ